MFQIDYFYFNHTQLSLMANGTYSESISVNLFFPVYSNVLRDFIHSQIHCTKSLKWLLMERKMITLEAC